MTHGIYESEPRYKPPAPKKKKKTETESLIDELKAHLNHVSKYDDQKHIHKKNVLEAAIGFLKNLKTFEDLTEAIRVNPDYNKAIFTSDTQQYVYKAVSLVEKPKAPSSPEPSLSGEKMKLILQLQTQLNAVTGKEGGKHADKAAVLQVAIDLLNGKANKDDLEKAIKQHPRYNEAFFTSKTEQLVNKVLEQAPKPEEGMHP